MTHESYNIGKVKIGTRLMIDQILSAVDLFLKFQIVMWTRSFPRRKQEKHPDETQKRGKGSNFVVRSCFNRFELTPLPSCSLCSWSMVLFLTFFFIHSLSLKVGIFLVQFRPRQFHICSKEWRYLVPASKVVLLVTIQEPRNDHLLSLIFGFCGRCQHRHFTQLDLKTALSFYLFL